MPNINVLESANAVALFKSGGLRGRIARLEKTFESQLGATIPVSLEREGLSSLLLQNALILKQASSQIDEIIHALGILRSLPLILDEDERIECLSLGAGNTGRAFDLETDRRVAEFKFIHWKGADSVRQDSLFKDFCQLAESET